MKKFLTAASLAALITVPALAQDATPPPAQNAPPAETMAPAPTANLDSGQISTRDLIRTSVRNAANESIGDVNDVLIDNQGKVTAVIVGVGGFLGLGEKDVALPFDQLTFARDNDNNLVVTSAATKESLEAAPEYKKPADRS
jgi:sporulation protein YlmC with PRC-barrel domain